MSSFLCQMDQPESLVPFVRLRQLFRKQTQQPRQTGERCGRCPSPAREPSRAPGALCPARTLIDDAPFIVNQ